MFKKLAQTFSLVGLLVMTVALTPVKVLADTVCNPTYGGGQSCQTFQLSVNKTILNPDTNVFVDNLDLGIHNFNPGDTVTFHVQVTNSGSNTLNTVTVVDTLPSFVTFSSGPGNFNSGNNTLTYTLNNLGAGASDTETITVKVFATAALSFSGNIFCPVNTAQGTADNSQPSTDTSKFCIQKIVTAPSTVPSTGASEWVLISLGSLMLGGYAIARKTQKITG